MPVRKELLLSILILTLFLLGACSKNVTLYKQALKEYKYGEFETSLNTNVQSLLLKPSYNKAQELIKKSYHKVVADREAKIHLIEEAAKEDMWDNLAVEYKALKDIQDLVKPLDPLIARKSGVVYHFDFKDYETELIKSKNGAAEYHYSRGKMLSEIGDDPDIQREAAMEFKTAMTYIPTYEDAAARYERSRIMAIKRVAILAFEDKSGARSRYGSLIDLLTESIVGKLVQDKEISEFMEIVTRDQMSNLLNEQQYNPTGLIDENSATAVGNMLGAHEIMTGKLIQINYVPPRVTTLELKETKNIVLGTEKYIDDNGKEKTREVKGDVTCFYNKYTKTTSVKIIASFNLIEVSTGKVKLQDTVTAEVPWTDTWGRIVSGDDRALSDASKALVSKEEPFPQSETDMVNSALDSLSNTIVAKVRNYVQN